MIRMLFAGLVAIFVLNADLATAQAQDAPTREDRERVRDCLNKHGDADAIVQAADCVGEINALCKDQETTADALSCYERHTAIWDRLLNDWYSEARKKLDSASSKALRDAQRAWVAFRDKKCGFWTTRYSGGSYSSVIDADCIQEETGRRAIEMHEIWKEANL
ncbi:MAG: lysozyme inhibitor LprI family protein [Methyloligella sp. ZOD6]